MRFLSDYLRRYRSRPHVRPWALATPVVVLLVCLPLLRPLRHPDPRQISSDEQARLATIAALVEHHTLAVDAENLPPSRTIVVGGKTYSDQAPIFAVILAWPYEILHRLGWRLRDNSVLAPYLLTLIGATLPAAGAAGLIYRMSRIFELPRAWRTGMAAAVIFGSGLISYAVVLNPHVLAATMVLSAAGCLVHIATTPHPSRGGAWLVLAGLCAALGAVIDPSAAVFLPLLVLIIPAMRWSASLRIAGVLLYLLGAALPVLLHAELNVPLTGDLWPGFMHSDLIRRPLGTMPPKVEALDNDIAGEPTTDDWNSDNFNDAKRDSISNDGGDDDETPAPPGLFSKLLQRCSQIVGGLIGPHGALSHFPVLIFGLAGMAAVMHRHWPMTTKFMASITAAGAAVVIVIWSVTAENRAAMFANQWFVVCLPFLLFWAGAWVRKRHHPAVWSIAGVLLGFSVIVSLLGATDPLPRAGYTGYTPVAALHQLLDPASTALPMVEK